jgi:hypothetical protein
LLAAAAAAAYLVPREEAVRDYLSNPPESTVALHAWPTYLYTAIAAGIATVILASCLLAVRRSLCRGGRRRWIVAVSFAVIVVLMAQSVRAAIEDGNLRRLDPDAPVDPTTSVGWVFGNLAWLPDYFLMLTPLVIFHAAVAVCVFLLRIPAAQRR